MVVNDPDEVFTQAVATGAKVISAVQDKNTDGVLDESSIPSGITGKSGNLYIEKW
jgi:hypothetical protein